MPGLVAGGALAAGRALGEFGATLMFAGSLQGVTQTAPLAIYERFSSDFDDALALSGVLVAVSLAILLTAKLSGGMLRIAAEAQLGAFSLDVELAVAPGECLALAGPSGAGKSSVLRVDRRPRASAERHGHAAATRVARHAKRHRPGAGRAPLSATCSRTTRCSRT